MRGLQATLPDNWGRLAVMFFDWRFNVPLRPRGGCWLSTVYKDCKAEARIWGYWSVRKAECNGCVQVVRWDRPARSPGPGKARSGNAVTSCIFDMQKQIHWFFIGVLGFRSCKCEAKCHPKRIRFSKTGKGALDFRLRDFMLGSYWMEAERKRYGSRCRVEERKNGHYIPDKFIMSQSPSRFSLFYSQLGY